MNIFRIFWFSTKQGFDFFCLLSSLPSHLGNSAELTEFNRFIPSSTNSKHTDVSGVGIDSVRTETVMTWVSCIGLGRFFEPCPFASRSRTSLRLSDGTDFMMVQYLISDLIRSPPRQLRLGRVVPDSAEFLNPVLLTTAVPYFKKAARNSYV